MTDSNTQQEEQLGFFVYIIESPAPVDLYHRRGEGDMLRQAVELNQLPCILRLAVNLEAFNAALTVGLSEALEATPNSVPILHISAHGYADGIQLSSGQILEWSALRDLLIPINRALNGNLVICMSTCEGYSGQRMAMVENSNDHPFLAIVGNCRKPTWPETAIGFATFYHLLANGRGFNEAVEAMRIASGNDNFLLTTAQQSQDAYIAYIQELDADEVKEDLEEQIETAPESSLAKLIRDSK